MDSIDALRNELQTDRRNIESVIREGFREVNEKLDAHIENQNNKYTELAKAQEKTATQVNVIWGALSAVYIAIVGYIVSLMKG